MPISWHLLHTLVIKLHQVTDNVSLERSHLCIYEKLDHALAGLVILLPVAKYNCELLGYAGIAAHIC